jgi:ankyrin repeat protein
MASCLAASGTNDHVIGLMGCWSSDCYWHYITTPPQIIAQAQRNMANPTVDKCFSQKSTAAKVAIWSVCCLLHGVQAEFVVHTKVTALHLCMFSCNTIMYVRVFCF